jgi:hypothetical protein
MVTGYEVQQYHDIRKIRIALEKIADSLDAISELLEELAKVPDPEQERGGEGK